jgi:hypothetical protein
MSVDLILEGSKTVMYIVVSSFKERAILNAPYRFSFYFYILYLIFSFYYLRVIFSQIIESWPSPWIGLEFKLPSK